MIIKMMIHGSKYVKRRRAFRGFLLIMIASVIFLNEAGNSSWTVVIREGQNNRLQYSINGEVENEWLSDSSANEKKLVRSGQKLVNRRNDKNLLRQNYCCKSIRKYTPRNVQSIHNIVDVH